MTALYDHEKRYQAMRNAAPELYEALEAVADEILLDGQLQEIVENALAKARGEA